MSTLQNDTMQSSAGLQIFLTGATGYVGGEVLHQLYNDQAITSVSAVITCLVRDNEKAKALKTLYPRAEVLITDLDDETAIKKQAKLSDVVLHMATFKHLKSAQAIVQGLEEAISEHPEKKACYVQISGASLMASSAIKAGVFGEHTDEVWSSGRDVEKVRDLIRNNPGREVDGLALSVMTKDTNLKIALVIGPVIYGVGHGPGNQRSIQGPDMTKYVLSKGQGFRLNKGLSRWSTIHVTDIASLMVKLVASSVGSEGRDVDGSLWNDAGIYLPETGVVDFTRLSNQIAEEAYKQGLLSEQKPEMVIDKTEADEIMSHGSILVGTNAVFDFSDAQKVPGWEAKSETLAQTLPALVRSEAKATAK